MGGSLISKEVMNIPFKMMNLSSKLMNLSLKLMNIPLKMMSFALKMSYLIAVEHTESYVITGCNLQINVSGLCEMMMDFGLKMMDFGLEMMDFGLKMMNHNANSQSLTHPRITLW